MLQSGTEYEDLHQLGPTSCGDSGCELGFGTSAASLRGVLAGVGFQDPQHFRDRLGVLMRAVARRDDAFALRAIHV